MTTVQTPSHENRKTRDDTRQLLRSTPESDEATAYDAQRLYGNSALGVGEVAAAAGDPAAIVQRARIVVQPRLTVGPVDDAYEREADSVAESVVQRLAAPPVQRQEDEEELQMKRTGDAVQRQEDEEELQMKRTGDAVQRQEDEEELQMKRTGDAVQRQEDEEELQMKRTGDAVQRQEDEEELQMKRTGDAVQRQEDEEELQMKRTGDAVQRHEDEEELQMKRTVGPGPTDLEPGVESQIQRARSGGSALDPAARTSMEGAIGSDFGSVRVHTGAEADSLNRSLSARAFTTGSDIFFRSGEYNPGTSQGQRLLAHELTHVVQQGGSNLRTKRIESDLQRKRAQSDLFFG